MLPTIEAIQQGYPQENYVRRYLLSSLLRVAAFTKDIDVSGRNVAVLGSGAGAEAFYLNCRGASVTAVDDLRYQGDDQFYPIPLLYEGTNFIKKSIEDWIVEEPDEQYDLIVALYTTQTFLPSLNLKLYPRTKTFFPHHVHRILKRDGIFLLSGDYLPSRDEMQPLVAEHMVPNYSRIKTEVPTDSEVNSAYVYLLEYEWWKYLKAVKSF